MRTQAIRLWPSRACRTKASGEGGTLGQKVRVRLRASAVKLFLYLEEKLIEFGPILVTVVKQGR